jgi:hypothetical protein
MQRGQTEIVGLIIIVLLVTMGFLFYLISVTNQDITGGSKQLYDSYTSNEQSTSFIQALLNTNIPACRATFEDVIVDCGRSAGNLNCQGGMSSCQWVEDVSEEVLADTLQIWGGPHGYSVTYGETHPDNFNITYLNCSASTVGRNAPGVFLIPYYPNPGTARIELGICR